MGATPQEMSFGVPEQVRLIKKQVDDFIEQEVKPLEEEYEHFIGEDKDDYILDDDGMLVDEYLNVLETIRKKSRDAGLYTMHMPEEVGGGGLSNLEYSMVVEHLLNRNPKGFHDEIQDTRSVSWAMMPCYHDDYLRKKYFEPVMNAEKQLAFALTEPDHGSDATWMNSTAEKDGDEWVINGTKCYIGWAPYAEFAMVHVRTSGEDGSANGISTFLVDRDNPNYEIGKIHRTMGSQTGTHSFCHFDDCRVPEEQMIGEEGRGFIDTAMQWIGEGRAIIPARCVGRCQWMFEQCVDYAEQRRTWGKPIGSRQFVQGMLADMRADIEQVRWLYRYVAWKSDQNDMERWLGSAVKLRGTELWSDVSDKAIQIHGGAGYMKNLAFEEEYRDAKLYRIVEGTDEVQKRTIAREFLDIE